MDRSNNSKRISLSFGTDGEYGCIVSSLIPRHALVGRHQLQNVINDTPAARMAVNNGETFEHKVFFIPGSHITDPFPLDAFSVTDTWRREWMTGQYHRMNRFATNVSFPGRLTLYLSYTADPQQLNGPGTDGIVLAVSTVVADLPNP